MYLSAERLALANQTVKETFEQTSVAWQAIPNWDTRDPSQTAVPQDNVTGTNKFLDLKPLTKDFEVTLAEAISPKPQTLLSHVIAKTVELGAAVDKAVFLKLRTGAPVASIVAPGNIGEILNALIDARVLVEKGGYRSPSCLVVDTNGLKKLTALTTGGVPGTDVLLPPANINCLQRVDQLEQPVPATGFAMAYLLGRRQRIACAGAADASPGEEALDLAVSVPPSLEVVGETSSNNIKVSVRITYALRIKDPSGYAVILNP